MTPSQVYMLLAMCTLAHLLRICAALTFANRANKLAGIAFCFALALAWPVYWFGFFAWHWNGDH